MSLTDKSQADQVSPGSLTEGWKECIHPNGWIYYYHLELHLVSTSKVDIPKDLNSDSDYDVLLDSQSRPELYINHRQRYASREFDDVQDDTKPTGQ